LICISLIAKDGELFLFAICTSSFEKSLFGSMAHLLIGLFAFLFSLCARNQSPVRQMSTKDFLSFFRLALHFVIFSACRSFLI
jgi:hypothetical protein